MNSSTSNTDFDVVIVGAGFCGAALGIKATDLGLNTKVLDSRDHYPDHFRAEKLEVDQYEALEELDLRDRVRPENSSYIDQVRKFVGEKETIVPCRKHRGMDYSATVNSFRSVLRDRKVLEIKKVGKVQDCPEYSEVYVEDDRVLRARITIIATGLSGTLRESLALNTHQPGSLLSTTFGFDIESTTSSGFPYTAFNFYPNKFISGLQFVTFFPVGNRLRVNLFTCWSPGSLQVRQFRADAIEELHRLFPSLNTRIGSFRLSGQLQMYTTRYYRQKCDHLDSTVLVGDAYQTVSPATGVGLSKCVTDIRALLNLLRDFKEDRSQHLDIQMYYGDEQKQKVDDGALRKWEWANEKATSRSPRTKIKNFKKRLAASELGGMLAQFRRNIG